MRFPRRKVVFQRVKCCSKSYCDKSSLHCIHYITDPKSSRFKSYFWAFVCIISTCLCFMLIHSQFSSYYKNRITTTIATTAYPIWEVPFPAVTLCNFNLVYRDNIEQFRKIEPLKYCDPKQPCFIAISERVKKHILNQKLNPNFSLEGKVSSQQIDNFFSNLSSLIFTTKMYEDLDWEEFVPVTKILARKGYNTENLMYKLMQPCENLATSCYWNNKEMNCSEIFLVTKTNSGYCCSFNYREIDSNNKKEYYVSGVGPSFGLYVHLNAEEEQYVSTTGNNVGVDVAVHENIEFPDMTIYSTTVHPGTDVSISVKPEITQSEESVKSVAIKSRRCAFGKDIKMEWAHTYSYNTCINECKARAIIALCRCVPFYYPIKRRIRFCTLPDMTCLKRHNINFKGTKITYKPKESDASKRASGNTASCRCYPQCNEISYSYQLDQQSLKLSKSKLMNDSILRVYFGHVSCTKLLRSVYITWEVVLASIGGLIGLCLGGSILSIIEFFYHIFEAIFSRYTNKNPIKVEDKKYKPKLYINDFGKIKNLGPFKQPNRIHDNFKDN